jgi:hypothetical protein
MNNPRSDRDASLRAGSEPDQVIRYPEGNVLAIVDTRDQLESLVQSLLSSGFLDNEVSVATGRAAAEALNANTGRSGLTHLVILAANRLGLQNEESETKGRYEEALHSEQFVVAVLAPTDARKELAAQLLASHGGRYINYLGRFSIERLGR